VGARIKNLTKSIKEKIVDRDNYKELNSDKEIALAKLNSQKELADKNLIFYKMIAIAITALLVLGLLIIYFISRKKRINELKMHQDELRHKEYMEASKQHNEHVRKMLDIIIDESADKTVKKEVVRLLKEQGKKSNTPISLM
jgi:type III secretory pathway component EscU